MASPLMRSGSARRPASRSAVAPTAQARSQFVDAGPFTGMRDSLDPSASIPTKASLLQNCYPQDPALGGGILGRPGFQVAEDGLGGISPTAQGVHQFTKVGGTTYTVLIDGGKFYTYDWTTRTATEVLTASDLSGASITLSATARIAFETFANNVVVSDGVNTPWMWDGTTNGGLTKLTNAPVFYGPTTVYYGKLFGIKAADRSTFVWSEEADPTIGYEAGGYNNAWQFAQSDTEPLTRLLGTNEALYVFRASGVATVRGEVADDFVAAGTRGDVSETIGTSSPWSVIVVGSNIFFLDTNARPQMIRPGGGVTEIWQDFRETTKYLPRTGLASAVTIEYTPASLVLFGVVTIGSTNPSLWLVYNTLNLPVPEAVALWRGYEFGTAAIALNVDGQETLVHQGPSDGVAYDHGLPNGSIWDDNTVPIQHLVRPGFMAADLAREYAYHRLDVEFRTVNEMDVTVDYDTPYGTGTQQTVSVTGGGMIWGSSRWGSARWAGTSVNTHAAIGINGVGRWIHPRVRHAEAGKQFGFERLRVWALPASAPPSAP